jgi:hypothetical protein
MAAIRVTSVLCVSFLFGALAVAQKLQALTPVATLGAKQTYEIPARSAQVPALLFDVPLGFVVEHRKAVDFTVVYISPKSAKWASSMGIYFGYAPSAQWPDGVREEAGTVSRTPVVWHVWSENNKKHVVHYRETLIEGFFGERKREQVRTTTRERALPPDYPPPPLALAPPPAPPDGTDMTIHVFVRGENEGQVRLMSMWVNSLRKK